MAADALCVGEVTLDLIETGRTDGGAPILVGCAGGAPLNVASGLGHAGVSACVWSAVGSDPAGHEVMTQIRTLPVSHARIAIDVQHPTRIAFISSEEVDDRRTRIQNQDSADQHLSAAAIPPEALECRILHISGAALLGDATAEAVLTMLRRAATRESIVVAFDPNVRISASTRAAAIRTRMDEALVYADVVQVDRRRLTTYWPNYSEEDLLKRVSLAVLTMGADGAVLKTRTHEVPVAARRAKVVDTTGAGDAFLASLLASLARNPSLTLSAIDMGTLARWGEAAAGAAAEVVSRVGGTASYVSAGT